MAYLSGPQPSHARRRALSRRPQPTANDIGGRRFIVGGQRLVPPGRDRSGSRLTSSLLSPPAPDDDGLGFSLKPPKFIRKAATAIKKNVTLKRALVGGAIVGAALVPGLLPAAAKFAVGAAKAVQKGVSKVGGMLSRPAAPVGTTPPIVDPNPAPVLYGPPAPATDGGATAPMLGPTPTPSPAPGGGYAPGPDAIAAAQQAAGIPASVSSPVPPSPGDPYESPGAPSNAGLVAGALALGLIAMASGSRKKGR